MSLHKTLTVLSMPRADVSKRAKRTTSSRKASAPYRRAGYRDRDGAYHSRTITFKRMSSSNDQIVTTDSVGTFSIAAQFTLNSLPNYGEFQNLFSAYRIKKVVARWIPLNGSSGWNGTSSSANLNSGLMCCAIDYNDATVMTTATLEEYSSAQIWDVYKQHYRVIYPKVNGATYYNSTITGYTNDTNPWIPTNYPGTPHYSFKIAGTAFPASISLGRLQYTYYIECRDYS